ncbi:unnamed protein product [Paramecium primaurelia]|uniref:Transmembrane protein n=1 Tax=Paramecium primaurelia TaxID=5886 RepID=A0A8S1QMS4_PARPR|nr:unnamed protein product [Paramecium primaurelia]
MQQQSFPLYLFILYEQQTEQTKFSPLRVLCSQSNIGKFAIHLFCFLIKLKQREIFQYFKKFIAKINDNFILYAYLLFIICTNPISIDPHDNSSKISNNIVISKKNEAIKVDQQEIQL